MMSSEAKNSQGSTAQDEAIEGRYANYFIIGHNAVEFLLDFGQMYRDQDERVHSRIVTSPSYAKELLRVLSQSVECYEKQFGEIGSSPHQ
jgi:hypothetical protein